MKNNIQSDNILFLKISCEEALLNTKKKGNRE